MTDDPLEAPTDKDLGLSDMPWVHFFVSLILWALVIAAGLILFL